MSINHSSRHILLIVKLNTKNRFTDLLIYIDNRKTRVKIINTIEVFNMYLVIKLCKYSAHYKNLENI